MRKLRLLLLFVALTLVIGVLPSVKAQAVDEEFSTDDGFIFRVQGYYNTPVYDLAGYTGKNPDVVIPEYVDNEKYGKRPVMRIAKGAFKDNTSIETVSIPASVTTIGKEAFMGCTSLKKVTFEGDNHRWAIDNIKHNSSYLTVNDRVFADCTKLTDFEILYGVDVTSGEDIFAVSGLKHIKIVLCGWTQNIPKIFNNCPELEVVDIDCESYEPGYSKRPGLNSMTGLPKLKEINVYGIENNGTLGIDYGSSSSDHIEKEDCPSLEYVNIYYSAEAVGVTAHAFANTEQTSSDPSVVLIEGNKTSGYYYRIKGAGVAEVSCDAAT
ncbi:MAG: leucine-rich repeat domain-containing protein, partial [Lachnospiraceae bacterium]|nr:leucine-rich repeat domain-containing protein [Lachnospiraceae bacterium]